MRFKQLCMGFMVMPVLLLACAGAWAAFGEDIEKPKPEFSQQDDDRIARLIPRGKSTAIQIRFHVEGGALTAVSDKQYAAENHPKVDPKNFRSDFFSIQASAATGAEVAVSVSSAYFTSATDLWGPVSIDSLTWGPTGATNTALADRVNRLTVKVRDGGPLDADGTANGRIEVIVGPRDSFWGYALGTLLIRFFGVFIVLGVLLLGMLVSGKIFQALEAHALQPSAETLPTAAPAVAKPASTPAVAPKTVAAIALALYLNDAETRLEASTGPVDHNAPSAWALFGRGKLMGDRMPVFDRIQKK